MIEILQENDFTFAIKSTEQKENETNCFATIQFQNGPVKEVGGRNGCFVEDILKVALVRLHHLDNIKTCRENRIAITKLEETLMWLNKRTEDRITRGVEGTNLD